MLFFNYCKMCDCILFKRFGYKYVILSPGVCLVESESGLDSRIVGGPNTDGSVDYGIFQVKQQFL